MCIRDSLEACPTCPPLYASLVGVRGTLGGLRDPDTVIEDAMAMRIREHLDDQVGPTRPRRGEAADV